jgi:hypothetical protein
MALNHFRDYVLPCRYSCPSTAQKTLLEKFKLEPDLVPRILQALMNDDIHLNSQISVLSFVDQHGTESEKDIKNKNLIGTLKLYTDELKDSSPTQRSCEKLFPYGETSFAVYQKYFPIQDEDTKEAWKNLLETRLEHMEKISPLRFEPQRRESTLRILHKQVNDSRLRVPLIAFNIEKFYTEKALASLQSK